MGEDGSREEKPFPPHPVSQQTQRAPSSLPLADKGVISPSLLLHPLTTSLLSFSWCIYERADIYCKPLPLPATMDAKQQRRVCGTLSTVQGDS